MSRQPDANQELILVARPKGTDADALALAEALRAAAGGPDAAVYRLERGQWAEVVAPAAPASQSAPFTGGDPWGVYRPKVTQ